MVGAAVRQQGKAASWTWVPPKRQSCFWFFSRASLVADTWNVNWVSSSSTGYLLRRGKSVEVLKQKWCWFRSQEIVHALSKLLRYWSSLVGHDRAKMLRIDTHIVEKLQLLAPGDSSKDRTIVKGLVHSGEVFSNFTGLERSSIWKRLKRTDGIIPSLYTFFKDLWYLESCANCIKRLITPSRLCPTIRTAMRAAFSTFDPAYT